MKTIVAALIACVWGQVWGQDETSLMQGLSVRVEGKLSLSGMNTKEGRRDATQKLMETATKMMKTGATPDVVDFIKTTITEVNDTVLPAIVSDHDADQLLINYWVGKYNDAVNAMNTAAITINASHENRTNSSNLHKQCRSTEALDCARSRRCEDELEDLWEQVEQEEQEMRNIHYEIEKMWCVHPPTPVHPDTSNPFHWEDATYHEGPETSQIVHDYFTISLPTDVATFRSFSVGNFTEYVAQKPIVELAWDKYNTKIVQCARLETELESQSSHCDSLQDSLNKNACSHAVSNREARRKFGNDLHLAQETYNIESARIAVLEEDRKAEWETLHQVSCILHRIYEHVIDAIDSGDPCITETSHPEQTEKEIRDCAEVNDGFTDHLTIDYGVLPELPKLPPVVPPPCSAGYVSDELLSFTPSIQSSHIEQLHQDASLSEYFTVLSDHGWAGCAAPKVCIPCEGLVVPLPDPSVVKQATACKLHEEYLRPGESDLDSFRCLGETVGGTAFCVGISARCNGFRNCADGSDEDGCVTPWMEPAVLQLSSTEECLSDPGQAGTSDDVQFFCEDDHCTSVEGRCNGYKNCAGNDDSDEKGCEDPPVNTIEATSGYDANIQIPTVGSDVFHDRTYTFDSLGSFAGRTFVKMHNDDKHTPHSHVQLKVRLSHPTILFVVKLADHELPWLISGGWQRSALTGVTYSGTRETRHTDWADVVLEDNYGPGVVYQKTFTAGTVLLPGNNGGDGSYLLFLESPQNPPRPSPAIVGSKCPETGGDRLFRNPLSSTSPGWALTIDQCYVQCLTTSGCKHFSYGEYGAGYVCMGCSTAANAQIFQGFNIYDMDAFSED